MGARIAGRLTAGALVCNQAARGSKRNELMNRVLSDGKAALAIALILYLAIGFYGATFTALTPSLPGWWPTAIPAVIICLLSLKVGVRFEPRNIILIVFGVLLAWMAIRIMPFVNPWGIRKLSRAIVWGGPILIGGYIVSGHEASRELFCRILTALGVCLAIWLVFSSVGSRWYYQSFGDATYQYTGITLGLCMLAAFASGRWFAASLIFLGTCITGNLSGPLFGSIVVLAVTLLNKDWRVGAKMAVAALILVGSYSVFVGPPVVVAKVMQKIDRGHIYVGRSTELQEAIDQAITTDESIASRASDGDIVVTGDDGKTFVADRYELYDVALQRFFENPIFGGGYGNVDYVFAGYKYPHNSILEILAETGIIGATLLVSLFLAMITCSFVYGDKLAICLAIYSILVSLVSQSFPSYWFMLAVGFAASAISRRKGNAIEVHKISDTEDVGQDAARLRRFSLS